MQKILILILLSFNFSNAQKRDIVYRIAYDSYPADGHYYGVSILYLSDDNSYRLSVQRYNSKKMARKNVLRSSTDEYGTWKISGDTLLCNDNKQPMKFIKINNRKIAFLIDGVDRSRYYWKKVKY